MRFVLLTAALWASAPLAAEYSPPLPPCGVDRDCPGALFCVGGQCLSKPPGSAADVAITPAPPPQEKLTNYGITLDFGVPDGLGLGVLWRPAYFLRVGGAGTYNVAGFGARGTVTVQLLNFAFSPTLTLDGGHYWAGNAMPVLEKVLPDVASNPQVASVLQKVTYDYANLQLGIEVGSTRHFMFYLRAGASYIQSTIPKSGAILNQIDPTDTSVEAADIVIRGILPSVKAGVVVFF